MLALMWSRRDLNAIIRRREIVCYVAGLSSMFAMIVWQKLNFPSDLGVVVSSAEEVRSIFLGYIRHWDHHRQRFDDPRLLVPGFLYALLALFFAVRFRKGCADPGGRLFLSIAAVSAILSIPLVFIPSWFDPALFPEKLIVAMPGRFINVAIFLATPLWIAKVIAVLRERNAYLLLVLVMGALLVVSVHGVSGHPVKQVMWLLLGLAVVAVLVFGRRPERLGGRASRSVDRASAALGPSFNKVVLYACGLAMCILPATYLSRNKAAIERRFEALTIPAGVQGSILVTFERWLLQLEVRHATLVPHIDGYAYLGSSALLALNSLTTDVFGISMKNEPARSMALHTSILWTRDYKVLWEGRTCQEWEGLARKYKFGLVVVPGDLVLQLPRADDDRAWGKYLPKCTS
jgi:hypothetical protein